MSGWELQGCGCRSEDASGIRTGREARRRNTSCDFIAQTFGMMELGQLTMTSSRLRNAWGCTTECPGTRPLLKFTVARSNRRYLCVELEALGLGQLHFEQCENVRATALPTHPQRILHIAALHARALQPQARALCASLGGHPAASACSWTTPQPWAPVFKAQCLPRQDCERNIRGQD